jgi:hypothetical protein
MPKNLPIDSGFIDFASSDKTKIQWVGGTSFIYDPIVAWGDAEGENAKIRGIIPDARVMSLPNPMDDTTTDGDGTEWICFTDKYVKGALWLRINGTAVSTSDNTSSHAQYRKIMNIGVTPAT